MANPSPLYLGIDTGGTFTDGVLLDPASRRVIKTVKAPTTHADLRICVGQVLESLIPDDPARIALVSLSTTLATNAIAEGKRRPVALLLLGYDPELVYNFNFHKGFGTDQFAFIAGRYGLDAIEQEPLDEDAVVAAAEAARERVDAFAVAAYAGPVNPSHEQRAAELIARRTGLPVVQAHHLSSELDSIRRATTASLNAALLSNLQEFLDAVEGLLASKAIHCPLMLVRGDASLVQAGYARSRPVEAIHSGPATSAIGGQFLSDINEALVIDIGGTTTDISLVREGGVQVGSSATTVGSYRTCVRTVQARSFGLGGDSLIRFDRWQSLSVGPERVIPLARLCAEHPQVRQDLLAFLQERSYLPYSAALEYWVLRRRPARPVRDARIRQALELLEERPQRLAELLKQVGARSAVQLSVDELINAEVIDRAGLTPTDLLHVTGEFAPWDVECAGRAAELAARHWHETPLAFAGRVKRWITRRITVEVIEYLSQKNLSTRPDQLRDGGLDRWLFEENLSGLDPALGCRIYLKVPVIGIGAPARAFLPPVAEALGARFLLPEHYAVANAVGTVVGNVVAQGKGEVFPYTVGSAILGYFARVGNAQEKFATFDEALVYTRKTLTRRVSAEAAAAGAPTARVDCQERVIWEGMVDLYAFAVGRPGQIPYPPTSSAITS